MSADINGGVFQFDETRFTSGSSSISRTQDILAPLCVNYFNFTHSMNMLSSIILNLLTQRKLTQVREFIIDSNYEICARYANTLQYSKVDMIIMIFAYAITDQHSRIPNFLKAVNANDKVTRKEMDGLVYYIFVALESKGNFSGTKVIDALFEYEFKKLPSFTKGSAEMIKKGTIVTNCCIERDNTEYLHKELFHLPKQGTPMLNAEVWKWSIKWNKPRPSDELYIWIDHLRDQENLAHKAALSDKKSIKIIDALWNYYRKPWYLRFILSLFLFVILWLEGNVLNNAGKDMLKDNTYLDSIVSICGFVSAALCIMQLVFNVVLYLGSKNMWKSKSTALSTFSYVYILWSTHFMRAMTTGKTTEQDLKWGYDAYTVGIWFALFNL